jgi:hypothetical protein
LFVSRDYSLDKKSMDYSKASKVSMAISNKSMYATNILGYSMDLNKSIDVLVVDNMHLLWIPKLFTVPYIKVPNSTVLS